MLVHYTCNNTNYLFILLETCVTCVTSVTLPRHLPTIVSARKPNKTAKTFEKIGKTSEKDRENSMVSEPSSTSEANKFFAKNSCSPKTFQSAKGLYGNGEITTPKRRSRRGLQQLTEAAQDSMLSM